MTAWCHECGRPRAVDAFSGEGGSSRGLMDAGWCVTAVDNNRARLRRNPAPHHVLAHDAVAWLAEHAREFALVWAGPPCQDYSAGTRAMRARGVPTGHQRLIGAVRDVLDETGVPYVIENVAGARSEMRAPRLVCGRMFGLVAQDSDGAPLVLDRHRLLESPVPFTLPEHPEHDGAQVAGCYGGARGRRAGQSVAEHRHECRTVRRGGYVPARDVQERLLGVDWMTQAGLYLAIPPAYAEHVGRQLLPA